LQEVVVVRVVEGGVLLRVQLRTVRLVDGGDDGACAEREAWQRVGAGAGRRVRAGQRGRAGRDGVRDASASSGVQQLGFGGR